MQINTDWNLLQLQKYFCELYGRVNRQYSPAEMMVKAGRCAAIGRKAGMQQMPIVQNAVVLACAWTIGAANKFGIVISNQIGRKYPMVCHDCAKRPCECGPVKPTGIILPPPSDGLMTESVSGMQAVFAGIYPRNTFAESMTHLCDETLEVGDAIVAYGLTGHCAIYVNAGEEFADVFANAFGVANTGGFSLIGRFAQMFESGCPGCHQFPCSGCEPQLTDMNVRSMAVSEIA